MRRALLFGAAMLVLAVPSLASAQVGSAEALAKQLANPISSLISVPFQYNFDCCFGPLDADRHLLNIQPVIPRNISTDWNVIIRTILPVIYIEAPAPGFDDTFGLSDTLQSFFFSPSDTPGGVTWGIGPAIQWPTGTDPLIDSGKWAAGPTFVILKQQSGWTYGILANQIWSFADAGGPNTRPEVNQMFLQPFLAYTWKDSTTLTLNSEFLLLLGNAAMERAPQSARQPHLQIRATAGKPRGRRTLVCRYGRRRTQLGLARRGHLPVPRRRVMVAPKPVQLKVLGAP